MKILRLKKTLLAASLAAAGLLGVAAPAHALLVSGSWDPAYGAPFPNLGWNGTATFEVPEECLGTVGTSTFLTAGGCSSQIDIVGATVNFYDTRDNSAEGTMVWGAQAPRFGLLDVYAATFGGGTLTGITTRIFDFVDGPSSFDGNNNFDFALSFIGTDVYLLNREWVASDTGRGGYYRYGINDFNAPDGRAVVTFTPAIPEPGTYALMLAGLAAVGFMARRRRQV